ncbi:hypothetical protein C8T65DRAFT_741024 [Cerioporus squamosus]|nr:hypothetical protein C8T65DRAFT_741024 [Cerioporus squamosus]
MSDSLEAELIFSYAIFETSVYINAAAAVLIFYDYVVTLGTEINLFWNSKLTTASALFHIIWYLAVASHGLIL